MVTEHTANDFPHGWKYQEGGGIYHWSNHKDAAPIHFAQTGSRKHTGSVWLTEKSIIKPNTEMSKIVKGYSTQDVTYVLLAPVLIEALVTWTVWTSSLSNFEDGKNSTQWTTSVSKDFDRKKQQKPWNKWTYVLILWWYPRNIQCDLSWTNTTS